MVSEYEQSELLNIELLYCLRRLLIYFVGLDDENKLTDKGLKMSNEFLLSESHSTQGNACFLVQVSQWL